MDVMVATIDYGRRTRMRRTTPTRYSSTVSSRAECSGSSTIGDNDIGGGIAMISDADVCRPLAVRLAYFGRPASFGLLFQLFLSSLSLFPFLAGWGPLRVPPFFSFPAPPSSHGFSPDQLLENSEAHYCRLAILGLVRKASRQISTYERLPARFRLQLRRGKLLSSDTLSD